MSGPNLKNLNLTNLRLKGIIMCSFARSEATNLNLFRQMGHYPGDLKKGEAFLFISKMGNQVIFIFRSPIQFEGTQRDIEVVDSRRLRLSSSSWNPHMLQNYANEIGLHLVGIKTFEQIHDEWVANKRKKRKA
jgi:hypothetical protein